ncbi:hypothetical protein EJB05_28546 [Eragrostis curvula]|uniref:Uncharacterized protein n=1 Tax=Eragrostis curvula TaxID=38414 RepID=A0A5J9URV5_9POAL|nr:hypothetical protein EJB05_28546 [Eragrostis curvula]
MACYLRTLPPAPSPFFLCSPHPRQTNLSSAAANDPVRSVKANALAAEVARAGDRGANKLSAWTSIRQERWEGDLAVEGHLPLWLNGTYLRNGAGVWEVGDIAFEHLFDGYAMLIRISFRQGRATGAHRQIESDAYKAAQAAGQPLYREFAYRPKPATLIERVSDVVGLITGTVITDNPNVTVAQLGDGRVVCLTETTKSTVLVDPDTLATVEKFGYTDKVGGVLQSGHPVVNESEFLTLLPDLFRPGYTVVRMEAGSKERKVVGRVECQGGPTPGWVHSFAVTEKYVVVPEMPLRHSTSIASEPPPLYAFDWLPESGSYMHVMCRFTGKKVASVEVPPFMVFHFINAYEEKGEDGQDTALIVDCCEYYADPSMLHTLLLRNLRASTGKDEMPDSRYTRRAALAGDSPLPLFLWITKFFSSSEEHHLIGIWMGRVGRFRIPLDGSPFGELETALDPDEHGRGVDMCSINPSRLGKKYRYLYACGAHRPCNSLNTLTKIDLLETTAKNWYEEGAVPSEPFFVARPGATNEDDALRSCNVNCERCSWGWLCLGPGRDNVPRDGAREAPIWPALRVPRLLDPWEDLKNAILVNQLSQM